MRLKESEMKSKTLETLDALDRWSDRFSGHCSQKRETERFEFRQPILIYVPDAEHEEIEERIDDFGMTEGVARNLSQGGLSFIHPEYLPADRIVVALCHDRRQCVYIEGDIVRRRPIHNEFWEYGLKFVERTTM